MIIRSIVTACMAAMSRPLRFYLLWFLLVRQYAFSCVIILIDGRTACV